MLPPTGRPCRRSAQRVVTQSSCARTGDMSARTWAGGAGPCRTRPAVPATSRASRGRTAMCGTRSQGRPRPAARRAVAPAGSSTTARRRGRSLVRHAARPGRDPGTSATCSRHSAATAPARSSPGSQQRAAAVSSSHAALRRSCQEIASVSARPVERSQQTIVERCVASPAATSVRSRAASDSQASRAATCSDCTSSTGFCSTTSSPSRVVATGTCAAASSRPAASNSIARLPWPPWSSARTRPGAASLTTGDGSPRNRAAARAPSSSRHSGRHVRGIRARSSRPALRRSPRPTGRATAARGPGAGARDSRT